MAAMATTRRSRVLRTLAFAAAALSAVVVSAAVPGRASAHGNIIDAPSRNFGCWQRWASNFQDPAMQTADPMCWQAWQANANTSAPMTLYHDGTSSCIRRHACSHGADFVRVGTGHQGELPDPVRRQPLGWATTTRSRDLDLVTTVGNTPAAQWTPSSTPTNGVQLKINATASHSGRAIVFTIWQASHLDQAYFFCSDVVIA